MSNNTYLPGPHKPGHNRQKTSGEVVGQFVCAAAGFVGIMWCLGQGYWLAILAIVLGVGSWLWFLEWMGRNEDRAQVYRAQALLALIMVALEARSQYQKHQVRERRRTHPLTSRDPSETGKWNAMDFGDR